jgi:hypothetical protein
MLYELLHKEQLDISHLQVFRCAAYVYLYKDMHANKLSPKAEL